MLAPLHQLLQKQIHWKWGRAQEDSFEKPKVLLTSSNLLVHFDPEKPLILTCDASPYGIGAVLSHGWDNDTDRPIYYASRSLATAERKYSQLDKEGLAIIFGVKKFHQFLYGRRFTIRSDHKPLQYIFGHTNPVPPLASARIQRWALTLGAYNYKIMYKPGQDIGHADGLSRLPLPETPSEIPLPGETILLIERLEQSQVNAELISQWTNRDRILSRVRQFLLLGWPRLVDEEMFPFDRRKDELSVENGCILWGSRVVVPVKLQNSVLALLHEGNPGISRMKSLARSFVWWPGMDLQLEKRVKTCEQCQMSRHLPAKVPLHPWEWPERPWSRIHVDYAGPFLGKWFLVIVDAHSKWMDIAIVYAATSSITIEKLRAMFATHGLPETIVSDNGTVFTSIEFQEFTKRNGIRHVRTAPYHPSSNGQVERAVQTFKEAMKKNSTETLETRVSRFLFHYRITPHSTTGLTPAEMLMGRQLRSHLSLLLPDTSTRVKLKQRSQKEHYDETAKERDYVLGSRILARNFPSGNSWLKGILKEKCGPLSYIIELDDGRTIRRHMDHIQYYGLSISDVPKESFPDDDVSPVPQTTLVTPEVTERNITTPLRRSSRIRHPPDRYEPES